MNREDVIARVAEDMEMSKASVERILRDYENVVIEGLLSDGKVHLHGFMTIESKPVSERVFTNPATGEEQTLPAKKSVKIKAGSRFRLEKMICE